MSDDEFQSVPLKIVGTLLCVSPERMAALERAEADLARVTAELASEGARWQALVKESRQRAERAEAERDALRKVLDGFTGPCPTRAQWDDICGKARELVAALKEPRT